jgi:hypothetical protein
LFRLEVEEPIKVQVKGEDYRSFSKQRKFFGEMKIGLFVRGRPL